MLLKYDISPNLNVKDQALFIGEQLISKLDQETFHSLSNDLLNGKSGVALFFLELHSLCGKKAFLEAGEKVLETIIPASKLGHHYGLYRGRIGVIYTLVRYYENTREKKWLQLALDLAAGVAGFIQSNLVKYRLYDGLAGTILGLLYLYQYRPAPQLQQDIELAITKLVTNFRFNQEGMYWDGDQPNYTTPPVGYANGVSGIIHVLQELYNFLNDPFYQQLAQSALNYRSSLWNEHLQNWENTELNLDDPDKEWKLKEMYLHSGEVFNPDRDSWSWYSGKIGNLLLPETTHRAQLDLRQTVTKLNWIDLSAYLYLEGDTTTITGILSKTIDESSDWNMENGLLGLGYFYLAQTNRKLNPFFHIQIDPNKNLKDSHKINRISRKEYVNNFWTRFYPRTSVILKAIDPQKEISILNDKFSVDAVVLNQHYLNYVEQVAGTFDEPSKMILLDVLHFESQKQKHWITNVSNIEYHLRPYKIQGALNYLFSITEETLLKLKFQLSKEVFLIASKWDWTMPPRGGAQDVLKNLKIDPDEHWTLCAPLYKKQDYYREVYLMDWFLLLTELEEPTIAGDLFEMVLENFEVSKEHMADFQFKFVDLFQRFIHEGFIETLPSSLPSFSSS